VRGIEGMVDDDLGLLDDHARHCVVSAEAGKREDRTTELMAAVGRLMRRG